MKKVYKKSEKWHTTCVIYKQIKHDTHVTDFLKNRNANVEELGGYE